MEEDETIKHGLLVINAFVNIVVVDIDGRRY